MILYCMAFLLKEVHFFNEKQDGVSCNQRYKAYCNAYL